MSVSSSSGLRRHVNVCSRCIIKMQQRNLASDSGLSVSSGGSGATHFPVGFDSDLLVSARREVFRAPPGYSARDCGNRIRELIQSEIDSPFTLRTTDLLILGNAVVSGNHEFSHIGVTESDIVFLINNHVSKRHRLQNALCIVQFAKFRNLTDSWNHRRDCELLCYSIDRLTEPRAIDMIELLRLLISQTTFVPSGTLFSSIEHALRRSVDHNPHRTNALALKLVETIYARNLMHSDGELISLSIELMNGRHCGSPTVLSKMIDIAEILADDIPLANRITEGIRLHQLSRWKSVKDLFKDPTIKPRLDKLLNGVSLAAQLPKKDLPDSVDGIEFVSAKDVSDDDQQRNPLGDWVVDDTKPVVERKDDLSLEKLTVRLAELEKRIAQYEERNDRANLTGDSMNNRMSNSIELKVRDLMSKVLLPVVVPVRPMSEVSFDEFREHVIRRKKTKIAQSVVARKLSGAG